MDQFQLEIQMKIDIVCLEEVRLEELGELLKSTLRSVPPSMINMTRRKLGETGRQSLSKSKPWCELFGDLSCILK